jgi:hypothetical protein
MQQKIVMIIRKMITFYWVVSIKPPGENEQVLGYYDLKFWDKGGQWKGLNGKVAQTTAQTKSWHPAWGGEVSSRVTWDERSIAATGMGSGELPSAGFTKSAIISNLEVITEPAEAAPDPGQRSLPSTGSRSRAALPEPEQFVPETSIPNLPALPKCYNLQPPDFPAKSLGNWFYYGGPGNCAVNLMPTFYVIGRKGDQISIAQSPPEEHPKNLAVDTRLYHTGRSIYNDEQLQ